jgi:hypothetical protein
MRDLKIPECWIIVNKETKEQWVAGSGKSSWNGRGSAKNAWNNHHALRGGYEPTLSRLMSDLTLTNANKGRLGILNASYKFDNQGEYELVQLEYKELSELEYRIKAMEEMIQSEQWDELVRFMDA